MGASDEEFDVEEWNRRLAEVPADPPRRPDRRHPSGGADGPDPGPGPSRGPAPSDSLDPVDVSVDPLEPGDAASGAEAVAEAGFPAFDHGQWTVEGEIERFGAFGRGAARARGWRRAVAFALVGLLVLPLVVGVAQLLARALS